MNEADPRVRRTRKLLQDALVELLAEKSFEAITVQDIATRSTINRATFYAHFVDKYDLFASYSREWFRTFCEARLPLGSWLQPGQPRDAGPGQHASAGRAGRPLPAGRSAQAAGDVGGPGRARAVLARLAAGGTGRARCAVPPGLEATAAGVSWAIFGTALDWSRMPERSPAEPSAAQIATLLFHGVSAD